MKQIIMRKKGLKKKKKKKNINDMFGNFIIR